MMDEVTEKSIFGVEKLDNLTLGKVLPGSMGLFYGPSGTGKSSIGYHFIFEGVVSGQNSIIITNEPARGVIGKLSNFEQFKEQWVEEGYISLFPIQDLMGLVGVRFEEAGPSDIDLLFRVIMRSIEDLEVKRVVIDPGNPLVTLLERGNKVFFFQRLKEELVRRGISLVFIVDTSTPLDDGISKVIAPYMFDYVLRFNREKDHSISMKTLTIEKWGGTNHPPNDYVLDISRDGVMMAPRIRRLEEG